jgi:probable rRNA maturation factor
MTADIRDSRSSSPISVGFESSGLRSGRASLARLTRNVLEIASTELGWPEAGIAVLYCSDEKIRELNRQFRELDEATDILSFPSVEDTSRLSRDEAPYLGDLAIAIPYTSRHARQAGHSLEEELELLLIHGLLHLLGWDHATPEEEKAMWAEQERLLELVHTRMG